MKQTLFTNEVVYSNYIVHVQVFELVVHVHVGRIGKYNYLSRAQQDTRSSCS